MSSIHQAQATPDSAGIARTVLRIITDSGVGPGGSVTGGGGDRPTLTLVPGGRERLGGAQQRRADRPVASVARIMATFAALDEDRQWQLLDYS